MQSPLSWFELTSQVAEYAVQSDTVVHAAHVDGSCRKKLVSQLVQSLLSWLVLTSQVVAYAVQSDTVVHSAHVDGSCR